MSKQELQGGCHCGKVRYQVTIEVSEPFGVARCNCSICIKSGWTPIQVGSKDDFKLTKPDSEKDLSDLASTVDSTERHRLICPGCGIHLYGWGHYNFGGKRVDYFGINGVTLDMPQNGLPDFSAWQVKYWDGRHDNWMAGQSDRPYPGGIV